MCICILYPPQPLSLSVLYGFIRRIHKVPIKYLIYETTLLQQHAHSPNAKAKTQGKVLYHAMSPINGETRSSQASVSKTSTVKPYFISVERSLKYIRGSGATSLRSCVKYPYGFTVSCLHTVFLLFLPPHNTTTLYYSAQKQNPKAKVNTYALCATAQRHWILYTF